MHNKASSAPTAVWIDIVFISVFFFPRFYVHFGVLLVRRDIDVNVHERILNITARHKVKEPRFYWCSTFQSH